ncbi:hypothetical protein VTK73DRAFT_5512 [Phialemonium thermophilum]|uniref:Uncharacterized protein n=1 Tax=Phialemonium thermophilum TaxID=223376 RepID=A0ABR3V1D2_9PEZI
MVTAEDEQMPCLSDMWCFLSHNLCSVELPSCGRFPVHISFCQCFHFSRSPFPRRIVPSSFSSSSLPVDDTPTLSERRHPSSLFPSCRRGAFWVSTFTFASRTGKRFRRMKRRLGVQVFQVSHDVMISPYVRTYFAAKSSSASSLRSRENKGKKKKKKKN